MNKLHLTIVESNAQQAIHLIVDTTNAVNSVYSLLFCFSETGTSTDRTVIWSGCHFKCVLEHQKVINNAVQTHTFQNGKIQRYETQ